MITYEWSFPSFEVIPSEDGLTNVVQTINWIYKAKDDIYTASNYGQVFLGPADPNKFIPYDQITKEWTISVVSKKIDVPAMELRLANEIENQKNPPIVPMAPPF